MTKWYAVRKGLYLGVFNDWYQVQQSIHEIESPKFKSFPTKKLAESWYNRTPTECDFTITRNFSRPNEKQFQLSFQVEDWKSKFKTTDQQKLIDKIHSVLKQSSATNFTINDIHIYSKLKTLSQFSTFFQNHKVRYTGKIFANGVTLPNSYTIHREPVVINKSL
jgi:viroplasmin and RNaseH domain-containing protein